MRPWYYAAPTKTKVSQMSKPKEAKLWLFKTASKRVTTGARAT